MNRRKPRSAKVLQGTFQKCRDRPEPEFKQVSAADPPTWVTDPDALAEWRNACALLTATRVLTEADLTTLAHYCNLHGIITKMWRKELEPTAAQMTQLRLFATEFGFTPASRSRARPAGDAASKNPFANLSGGAS